MTRTHLRTFVVACCLTSSVSLAVTAGGALKHTGARITALTTYPSSGAYHSAMDMGGAGCWKSLASGAIYHRAMLLSTRYYSYLGGCGVSCASQIGNTCNGGAGNVITTHGANGWDFRQKHINHNSTLSRSKTCYRCGFGLIGSTGSSGGAHVHAENRRYRVRQTYWYTRIGKRVGQSAFYGYTMGYPTL